MSTDSPLFDGIRVKPDEDRRLRASHPACEWPGCNGAATHRAPKGRDREKEYWRFCLGHVREYNHSYNFFAGMSTDDIAKSSVLTSASRACNFAEESVVDPKESSVREGSSESASNCSSLIKVSSFATRPVSFG